MLFVDSDMEEDDQDPSGSGSEEDDVDVGVGDEDDDMASNSDVSGSGEEVEGVAEGDVNGKTKKKKKKKKKEKGKISSQEAKDLREKEHTYSTNLYRVQIEELLKEVTISEKRRKEGQEWFEGFKKFIMKAKPSKPHEMCNIEQLLKGVMLPLPSNIKIPNDSNEEIRWVRPEEVEIVGSWKSGAAVDKTSSVDVAITLPAELFRKKDYLNHRYHIKRAIYLAYVANLLLKRGDTVSFSTQQGNPIMPVLVVECKQFTVKIVTKIDKVFKPSRLSKDLNNLRFQHFMGKELPEDEPDIATPNYNCSILQELLIDEAEETIHGTIESCEGYRDAIKLIKVWLHQRHLDQGFGSFSGFLSSAYIVYLSNIGKIDVLMSAYDVLRIFFVNLSQLDLVTEGIGLCDGTSFKEWMLQFEVVFVNSSGLLNYAADMSKFTFERVQEEARNSHQLFEQNKISSFHALFLTPIPFVQNFDQILQVKVSEVFKAFKENNEQSLLNYSGHYLPVIISVLGELLEKCFGQRVQKIDHEIPEDVLWDITSSPPECFPQTVQFGFVINREAAYKLVEKCDIENSDNVKTFKEMWGEKSQLRRFKDGTMCETVVFEDKSQVLFQILSHILQNHLDIKPEMQGIRYLDCQIESVVEKEFQMIKKLKVSKKKVTYIKGKRQKPSVTDRQELVSVELDTVFDKASQSFDDLARLLRSLTGLPLEVTSVQGASPVLRFTAVHPTPPQIFPCSKLLSEKQVDQKIMKLKTDDSGTLPKVPKVVEPIVVILHLETSGKWPDNIAAVDRLKCAFLSRIGQLLNNQYGLLVQVYPKFLDVLKDGFIFRIKLTYYRELTLLKQHLGPDGVLKFRDSTESLYLEKETLLLPQLTTTLHSFHRQYEAFGKTCRLAKRWISSQLLLSSPLHYCQSLDQPDCRFTEEAIELMVAYTFIYCSPHLYPPNEGQVGFLRFLSLLSNCDWKATPLLVNFHEKLTPEDISGIELDFVKRRHQLPPLFIATPEDKSTSVWTKHLAPVILYRAQLLAKEALGVLQKSLIRNTLNSSTKALEKQIKIVFRPTTHEFDVLIHLKKSMNPRSTDQIDSNVASQFHEFLKSNEEVCPIINFDPVQTYLSELRQGFGHLAIFLHDTFGGKYIAVVWKPEAFQDHEFSVSNLNARRSAEGEKIFADVDEVIESFDLLGHGIVDNIERRGSFA